MSGFKDLPTSQRDLRASTAERLATIMQAAERAAEGVIDDAEAQARSYLAEARSQADREVEQRLAPLAGLSDALLAEATALRQQAERLQATLEAAKERLEAAAPEGGKRGHLSAVEDAPPPDWEADRRDGAGASGARLLATQMAVSGSSREEIASRLRKGFEIEDAGAILDAILGPEE